MRVELQELLDALGVDRILSPYETQPWYHYDAEQGITCSAEVRMGPDSDDLEAEIQFVYDEPQEEIIETEEEEDSKSGSSSGGEPETRMITYKQIMLMRALPVRDDLWSPRMLFVKGKDFTNAFGDWDKKSCEFFKACIGALLMSEIPDVDELIEKELSDSDRWGGGRSGRIGRKSPNVKPGALLGMKKGM